MHRHCYIRTFFSLLDNRSDILELLTAILENRAFLTEEPVFIGFQGSYGMHRHCYIRTFFDLLDDRSDILELLTAILENRIHLLEKPHHIFEDRPYIRTFSVLLELPAWILELSAFY
ncbi:hypothetical protein A9986_11665 [Solibacillus silvestris]|nr:hypothetical protein A9986_11665 [Solibacillus silvestris]